MGTQNHTKRGKLARLAAEKGVTVDALVSGAIEESETIGQAAAKLGVTPNSVQWWIVSNRYQLQVLVRRELRLVKETAHE